MKGRDDAPRVVLGSAGSPHTITTIRPPDASVNHFVGANGNHVFDSGDTLLSGTSDTYNLHRNGLYFLWIRGQVRQSREFPVAEKP